MDVKTLINTRVQELFNLSIKDCSNEQAYIALLSVVKDLLDDKKTIEGDRKVYYFSAEFLIGKLMSNNLINLGIRKEVKELFKKNGKSLEEIEEIKQLREQYPDKKKTNIMFMMGKYDFDSKYNIKNITRMLKETKEISAVPYNIGFYEASMEGKVADFFLNNRTLNDSSSANAKFLQECKRGCDNILAKLEDLKMRM